MLNRKIKAFTLSELMVTLALTGMLISFTYLGYGFVQKLLAKFNEQTYFINQVNELNKRFSQLSFMRGEITLENETKFMIKTDSTNYSIEFAKKNILMSTNNVVDTFKLESQDLKNGFETLTNQHWNEKLVNNIEFDVLFEKEKFHLVFNKQYDAYSKLILETQKGN
ncbi:MAG TPA: prepilin-type N-terminal cleavage/methylation domain-containing protein [Bacteroidia bacterium]|jgi:prepilin-type N-terminal cleavage/methylation domain-containing protein|nr:prepilin-type N-terminal cleavage/methylation domain-containing protein [Bacteroidia bacterium]